MMYKTNSKKWFGNKDLKISDSKLVTEEIKRLQPLKDIGQREHTIACSQFHISTAALKKKTRIFPERVEYGRNSKYQTQRKEEVSPLHRNGWACNMQY